MLRFIVVYLFFGLERTPHVKVIVTYSYTSDLMTNDRLCRWAWWVTLNSLELFFFLLIVFGTLTGRFTSEDINYSMEEIPTAQSDKVLLIHSANLYIFSQMLSVRPHFMLRETNLTLKMLTTGDVAMRLAEWIIHGSCLVILYTMPKKVIACRSN